MQTSLTHLRRQQGTILLAVIVVVVVVVIGLVGVYIILRLCKGLPDPGGRGGTNQVQTFEAVVPEAMTSKADFPQKYRLILQRTTNGTDWDDLAGADYSGHSITISGTTNWTQLGLFRFKAMPVK